LSADARKVASRSRVIPVSLGEQIDKIEFDNEMRASRRRWQGFRSAAGLLGITKASLETESF